MKKYVTILFFFSTTIITAQQNADLLKSEIDFGNGFSLTTFFSVFKDNTNFKITSPKNADCRLFGGVKSKVARVLGKSPKKGILVTIEGNRRGDSLLGFARIPTLGTLEFKGIIIENELKGSFLNNQNEVVGNVTGEVADESHIDYEHLYPKIVRVTNDYIFSKEIMQTKKWLKFQKDLEKLCSKAKDDMELFLGFNMLSSTLTFSHFNLILEKEFETSEEAVSQKSVFFEEIDSSTAYVKISNFSSSKQEIGDVFPRVINNSGYKNLILDLRDNPGGGLEAALELAKYILHQPAEVGYFITNKFRYTEFETELFETLPETTANTTSDLISELKVSDGVKLVTPKNNNAVFSGNMFILTNTKTASTSEPIVYLLKNHKRATVVGEKTSGAMLSAAPFEIYGKYKLILPLADFYTYDGYRIESIGVLPDIITNSENALDKVLNLIKEDE